MAGRGVVKQEAREFDQTNKGKVVAMLPADAYVAKYVDQNGVVKQTLVYRAGQHFYISDELESLGASLGAPAEWFGKALARAFTKLQSYLKTRKVEDVESTQETVPTTDSVVVD